MVRTDCVLHFLCVPNWRFGVWFADGSDTHPDMKLAEGQCR